MDGLEWLLKNGKYVKIGENKVFQIMIEDMEEYAKFYHESELKKLRVADVIESVCSSVYHDKDMKVFGHCNTCFMKNY
jgi:hypothetical protein